MNHKIIAIILGIMYLSAFSAHAAETGLEIYQNEVEQNLEKGGKGFDYLDGIWLLSRRFCVERLTNEGLQNPTEVMDISNYYIIWNFKGSKYDITLFNADLAGNRCTSHLEGSYAAMQIPPRPETPVNAIMATNMELRLRTPVCSPNYGGPAVPHIHNVIMLDQNHFYASAISSTILPPGQAPTLCANPNNYHVNLWTRLNNVVLNK